MKLMPRFRRDVRVTYALGIALLLGVGLVFAWVAAHSVFLRHDYTFEIATAFWQGHLGILQHPHRLNELVPGAGGRYYSAFPLGAVLVLMVPSMGVSWGWSTGYPVAIVVGILAAGCAGLAFAYTAVQPKFTFPKRLMLASWLVFGTWFMTNIAFGSAWNLALGFAVLGQLAALYWSVVRPNPLLCGLALAVAFGNRTEIVLTAPVFLEFLLRPHWRGQSWQAFAREVWPDVLKFCAAPLIMGVGTMIYNAVRFGSAADFGYAHIPGVLKERWYRNGIFSVWAIPVNLIEMLFEGFRQVKAWPLMVPTGMGGSILVASPFLWLLARKPAGDWLRVRSAWVVIAGLTLVLWLHGNPGGWQYSYRYALVLLPWFLVLFVEYLPPRITTIEGGLWVISVGMSAYATYLFIFTRYLSN